MTVSSTGLQSTARGSSRAATRMRRRRSRQTTPRAMSWPSTAATSVSGSTRAMSCASPVSTGPQAWSRSRASMALPSPGNPRRLAARRGGMEVYAVEAMELRRGDRICWTCNDRRHGLVNSGTAEVTDVNETAVAFRLEDGRPLVLRRDDPQLRHIDRAWAATVHAFQGRTVDRVIAAMEAEHAHLTTQKTFYVEISRARVHAELVTDDRRALRERLEAATGERIAALEAIAPSPPDSPARDGKAGDDAVRKPPERDAEPLREQERERSSSAPAPLERGGGRRPRLDRTPARPAYAARAREDLRVRARPGAVAAGAAHETRSCAGDAGKGRFSGAPPFRARAISRRCRRASSPVARRGGAPCSPCP